MPIRKLPVLLVNQIAAGEVIERPASVVKELVENSLDARATRIEVAVEDGGRQLIRVSDDGVGIPMEELPLAVAPHATSKIESAQDLAAIRTLGFRGEALASIASVSRLRLVSRATVDGATAEAAGLIEASGEQVSPVQPASGSPGTVVEVRDLFFNTPARRKFLRSASTEMGHISDIIARLAMVHPRVGFRLTHNGRTVIDLPAESSHARRVVAVLGRDLEEGLLEFELIEPVERGGNRVWGLAGQPALARATSRFQYLSVNSRPIRDRYLAHAVKEAYRGLIPPDQQPVAAVFIEIDPAAVDVNAHPAKAEVRFRQPQQVHGLVLAAIRQRLLGSDLTPSWSPPGASAAPVLPLPAADAASAIPATPAAGSATDDSVTRQFVDYFRRMDPTQKGFVYQEVKRVIQEELPQAAEEDSGVADSLPQENWSLKPQSILQVHRSYVVTEDEEGLLIVDQHALHERVMFQELSRRVLGQGQRLESQRLLMPQVVQLSPQRQALLNELAPLLERIGLEAAPIGPDAVGIQAFPSFLFDRGVEPDAFLNDLLDRAQEEELTVSSPTALEAALHRVLDLMACKAAVKAGDRLSEAELAALLAKRQEVERASNCPHGRPTAIRLTLRDLEKHFGRR